VPGSGPLGLPLGDPLPSARGEPTQSGRASPPERERAPLWSVGELALPSVGRTPLPREGKLPLWSVGELCPFRGPGGGLLQGPQGWRGVAAVRPRRRPLLPRTHRPRPQGSPRSTPGPPMVDPPQRKAAISSSGAERMIEGSMRGAFRAQARGCLRCSAAGASGGNLGAPHPDAARWRFLLRLKSTWRGHRHTPSPALHLVRRVLFMAVASRSRWTCMPGAFFCTGQAFLCLLSLLMVQHVP